MYFSISDVIPSPSVPVAASTELNQETTTVNIDESPVVATTTIQSPSVQMEETKLDVPAESKRHTSPRCGSHHVRHSSHPVPQPLSLQGEKTIDPDCIQTTPRTTSTYAINNCQRRGSFKSQPVITELFADATVETQNHGAKPATTVTKPSAVKMRKPRRTFVKPTKTKKPLVISKQKILPKPVENTNVEIKKEEKPQEDAIIIAGTDWVMSIKPQVIHEEESILSPLFEAPTIDDEDLPSCASPTDQLDMSQATVMTSFADNLVCSIFFL